MGYSKTLPSNIVVVDSLESRLRQIAAIIDNESVFKIIGTYKKGSQVLSSMKHYKVDLVICAEKLSDMTGYKLIVEIMKTKGVPVLLHVESNSTSIIDYPRALDYSIVDSIEIKTNNGKIVFPQRIVIRSKILSKLNVNKFISQIIQINNAIKKGGSQQHIGINGNQVSRESRFSRMERLGKYNKQTRVVSGDYTSSRHVIVFGASTGGPRLITYLISQLPPKFPPVIVIQHMPKGFVGQFSQRISKKSLIRVKKAEHNEAIVSGTVYIAPGGYHLELVKGLDNVIRINLDDGPRVNYVRPSVDVTLFSAARIYGSGAIGVILTGMGSDGREGCRVIKKIGGKVIALNEEDSILYGMNKAVIDAGLADRICGMDRIIPELTLFL